MTQEAFILDDADGIANPANEQPQIGSGTGDHLESPEQGEVSIFETVLSGGTGSQMVFKMRGRDDGRPPGSDYITWISEGDPDFAGAGFSSGTPTPIGNLIAGSVTIADQWAT